MPGVADEPLGGYGVQLSSGVMLSMCMRKKWGEGKEGKMGKRCEAHVGEGWRAAHDWCHAVYM